MESALADLIILDIEMPNHDGIDFLAWLLKNHYSIPVIIFTADPAYRDHYLCWSVAKYLIKSDDLSELKTEITEVLKLQAVVKL